MHFTVLKINQLDYEPTRLPWEITSRKIPTRAKVNCHMYPRARAFECSSRRQYLSEERSCAVYQPRYVKNFRGVKKRGSSNSNLLTFTVQVFNWMTAYLTDWLTVWMKQWNNNNNNNKTLKAKLMFEAINKHSRVPAELLYTSQHRLWSMGQG